MSPNFDDYTWDTCGKYICAEGVESESPDKSLLVFSESCSGLSSISDLSPKTDGSTYKRRKLRGSSVALLSEVNTTSTKLRAYTCKLRSYRNHCTVSKDNTGVSPIICINGGPIDSFEELCATASDERFTSKDKVECSSGSTNMKSEVVKEALGQFSSVKDMCIYVLKKHGLLAAKWNRSERPSEVPCSSEVSCSGAANRSQPCKICGHLEDPSKMLICDSCEEAFHPSCCNFNVKELPFDDWYCQPCFKKKPEPFLQASAERSFNIKDGNGDRKQPYRDLIPVMLEDTQPYETDVRIGRNFQVELPDPCGPNSNDHDYFGKPSEMDPKEFTDMKGWGYKKANSFGNWLQCQKVIDTDENGQDIICGKWRRSPLFLEQTEDWDCSCAVTWDPFHADCAVPQELAMSEVLKHLKFVKEVNNRLAAGKLQRAKESWPRSSQSSSGK